MLIIALHIYIYVYITVVYQVPTVNNTADFHSTCGLMLSAVDGTKHVMGSL
jgi:hypothetical protein